MNSEELSLRIKEAHYRDVGKGYARISKENMKNLAVTSGDVLEIESSLGKKTTAIVWPAYSADEKKNFVSIDATTRSNAGVRLDEIVKIRKVISTFAKRIVLKPNTKIVLGNAAQYFSQMLKGRPFSLQHLRSISPDHAPIFGMDNVQGLHAYQFIVAITCYFSET